MRNIEEFYTCDEFMAGRVAALEPRYVSENLVTLEDTPRWRILALGKGIGKGTARDIQSITIVKLKTMEIVRFETRLACLGFLGSYFRSRNADANRYSKRKLRDRDIAHLFYERFYLCSEHLLHYPQDTDASRHRSDEPFPLPMFA